MSATVARIGDIAEQVRGVTYSSDEVSSQPKPGLLPVLRAGNITDSGLVFEGLVFVPANRVGPHQRVRRNDVVIAVSSGSLDVVGKAARATADFEGGFGAFCKVLRPKASVEPSYFAHFFKTPEYRRRVSALAAGININNLRNEHLDQLQMRLPSLREQARVAAVLDRAEALRAKRRASLALLDTLPQSIFLEMFGDPATNSKLWPVAQVADCIESATYGTSEKAQDEGEFPVLRMNNVTSAGELDLTDIKFMNLPGRLHDRYLVRQGDLLFNRTNSRDLVGKTAIVREHAPMAYAGYLIRLRVHAGCDPEYLVAFLNSRYAKAKLRGMCKSIIGMANINAKEIQGMTLPVPPLEMQRKFASRVRQVLGLKQVLVRSARGFDAVFMSLQQRAFRGEL
ncbi:MAG: restriction endonuclease subunit S [Vicinamibacterales bacterium]